MTTRPFAHREAQRSFDMARSCFEFAEANFQMAEQTRKSEVEQRAAKSAAEYMSAGFRHLALAESLTKE